MFGKSKKKKDDEVSALMQKAVFQNVLNALTSILDTEYKKDGTEDIDWELTVRMMKAKARLALNFASMFPQISMPSNTSNK